MKKNDWISIMQEVHPSCWKLECSVNKHNLRQQLIDIKKELNTYMQKADTISSDQGRAFTTT